MAVNHVLCTSLRDHNFNAIIYFNGKMNFLNSTETFSANCKIYTSFNANSTIPFIYHTDTDDYNSINSYHIIQ